MGVLNLCSYKIYLSLAYGVGKRSLAPLIYNKCKHSLIANKRVLTTNIISIIKKTILIIFYDYFIFYGLF